MFLGIHQHCVMFCFRNKHHATAVGSMALHLGCMIGVYMYDILVWVTETEP
jgi:hypothetical protein